MSRIAILLTVFNRKESTINCIRLIKDQILSDCDKYDIFITDGGSTDGTAESIGKLFPEVHIQVKDGVYWNRGMYASWEMAGSKGNYDHYLWLNDDTYLYNDCIKTLLKVSDEHDNKSIIVGATVDTKTNASITYGGFCDGHLAPLDGKNHEVFHFNGNIVLIPSAVYAILGNLDYYYTHSKGDFDYGIRAYKAGIKMFQVGKALGECDVHPHIDKWCDPKIPLKTRWRLLHLPNGMPPKETFHLEKQESIIKASVHYITVIIRCIFPSVWTSLRNNN